MSTATSKSPSERWLLIGDAHAPRRAGFEAALARRGASTEVLGYEALDGDLAPFGDGDGLTVRLDSPGRFAAFGHGLDRVRDALPAARFVSHPDDVALAFDKPRCQRLLAARGIPVPPLLGEIDGYEDLVARMRAERRSRVFVKLAHGSTGCGVVAYRTDGERHQAFTTVASVDGDTIESTRRVRTLTDRARIAALIDALASHRVYAEGWVPKRGMSDVRVLVLDGAPAHMVVRTGRTPITNLHLGADRAPADARTRALVDDVARRAALCFPRSLHVGLDIAISTTGKPYVLEVNAFGDLLNGVLHDGQTTYELELAAWSARRTIRAIVFDLDGTLPPDDRVRTLLAQLGERYRIAVLTNGAASTQRRKLATLGARFDATVISGELGVRKPSPALFRRALRLLGASPEETLMVGDDYDVDLAPAARIGMRTHWVGSIEDLLLLPELLR